MAELARRLTAGLAALSGRAPGKKPNTTATAFQVIESYERLSGEVYRLRSNPAEFAHSREAEDLLVETAGDLFRVAKISRDEGSFYEGFISSYRALWRKHFDVFLFTTTMFIGCCWLGWDIGLNQPDYVTLIAGHEMMETIHDHKAWFEAIQGNSLFEGAMIAWNNIKVSLMAFALGSLLGIGGLAILIFNGLMFGCILGYCYKNGFHAPLIGFVVSHGPLELTIIIASSFAGLLIGRAFYVWPLSRIPARLALAAKEAGTICLGVIPWLILAAFFEGFVSPYDTFPFEVKVAMGLFIAALFWWWTFAPIPQAKRELRKS